jgi:hypothetical protein
MSLKPLTWRNYVARSVELYFLPKEQCVVCCEMAGSKWKHSISKKTAVVKMYAGVVVRYSHQIVCLNAILQTKRSVQA